MQGKAGDRRAVPIGFGCFSRACNRGCFSRAYNRGCIEWCVGRWHRRPLAIKDRSGLAFVQYPSEALYDSMPKSAIQHVETDSVGTLVELAERITTTVKISLQPCAPRPDNERYRVENGISVDGNGLGAGVMNPGKVSNYTCPDCHGVLVQINEGSIVRFRCHTGHAFQSKPSLPK